MMHINRKDIGYTIYSRLEESLRAWVRDRLLNLFGAEWISHVPDGIWSKVLATEGATITSSKDIDDPETLIDETNIPDIMEIVCYKNSFSKFVSHCEITVEKFRETMGKLYEIRCKIAHVKRTFSAIDLDLLIY